MRYISAVPDWDHALPWPRRLAVMGSTGSIGRNALRVAEGSTDVPFPPCGGPAFRIDRVLDVRQAASRKAGGQGIRYVCEVEGSIAVLFHDEPYWFIEQEESVSKA